MACIEHYVEDAENLFSDIVQHHKLAQDNAYKEYCAARAIQKWYRGYVVRKYLKYLHSCATTIQKHWKGFVDRKLYEQLLKETVHKLYWEHYNNMATKIQKVWRGHYVRTRVFSYYRLKEYIRGFLQMNKEFMEEAKVLKLTSKERVQLVSLCQWVNRRLEQSVNATQQFQYSSIISQLASSTRYEELTKLMAQRNMEKECQEKFAYLSRRVHHLLRTYQIEGIFSNHGTTELSNIEQILASVKFMDYMKIKRAEAKQKEAAKSQGNYIFEGRMRECEEVWRHRNDPGKYSLATGEYGEDERRQKQLEKVNDTLRTIHDQPMKFGSVRHNGSNTKLDDKPYQCPPHHRSLKNVPE